MLNSFTGGYSASESRNLFNQGFEAYKTGNYTSAELLFRKTIEFNDDNRDRAWFYLSITIYQQGKYKAAIFEFNSFLTKCRTENLRIESRFWMGEAYLNLNDSLKAIEEYNRFLEKADDLTLILTAHDRIANIYYNQKRYEESIIEWEKAIKKSSDREFNAGLVLKIGRALFMNEKYDNAIERLNPLLTSRIDVKKKSEIRLIIGRIFQLQNDHKKALVTFNAISTDLAETPPFYDMFYFRAVSYLATDRVNLAKSDFELFSIIGKKSDYYYDGLYEYGKLLLGSQKPETGLEILDKVCESQEKLGLSVKSGLLLAEYFLEKDPKRSVKYLEKFNNYENEDYKKSIIITLSKAYIKIENYENAELKLKGYLEKYPYDDKIDEVKFLQARILLEKGDSENATIIFNDLKKSNPFSKYLNDSDYYLALVSFKKGKTNEAISLLKKYIYLKDINYPFEAHILLAEMYFKNDDIKNLEKEINILLSSYSGNSGVDKILYRFALIMNSRNTSSAIKYFNILQNRYPDSNYTLMINLITANRYFENRNYAKAVIYYEKFLNSNIDESRGNAYYNMLISYYALEDYSRVIEIIKNLKIPPLDEIQWREIPLIHARALYKLSKFEEVYNILKWEDIKTFSDDDAVMLIVSTVNAGDLDASLGFIEKINDRGAVYFDQLLLLGNQYQTNKNFQKSEEIYKTILVSNSGEGLKESTRIELAIIKMEMNDFNQSIAYLNQVELDKNIPERDSLIILNHFRAGKEKAAAGITESCLKYILDNRFSEKVLVLNLEYHYKNRDLKEFLKYQSYLKKFKNHEVYSNLLMAKLFYNTGDYKKSYNTFYKLSLKDNQYLFEINYYLGRLSLLYNKNKTSAIKYYLKALENDSSNEQIYKIKIDIALIYYEMKNYETANNYLNSLMNEKIFYKYRIESENINEYYGSLTDGEK